MIKKITSKVDLKQFLTYYLVFIYFQFSARILVVFHALQSPIPDKSLFLGKNYYWVTFYDFIIELSIGGVISFLVLFFLFILLRNNIKFLKWVYFILAFPSSLLIFLYSFTFNSLPSIWAYFSLFTTNKLEVRDFFSTYYSHKVIIIILFFLAIIFILSFAIKKASIKFIKTLIILFLITPTIILSVVFVKKIIQPYHFKMGLENILGNHPIKAWIIFKEEQQKLKSLSLNKNVTKFKTITRGNPQTTKNETYVIVIGESITKRRMEVYGYQRETNPYLRKENEIYLFNNVKTAFAYTTVALKHILTFATSKNDSLFFEVGSLINLINDANFNTTWISNQASIGFYETPVIILASQANNQKYTNLNEVNYDDKVLPFLDNALNNNQKKRVIFIHLMGAHHTYNHRYPEEFNFFNNKEIKGKPWLSKNQLQTYNEYDNAIRYNDYIIYSILEKLKSVKGIAAMLYFSDHGEEVFDRGPFSGRPDDSPYVYEVPFIFWGNKEYFSAQPAMKTKIEKNLDTPFNTENLPHFVQEMTDIYTEYYDSTRSILKY